MTGPVDLLVRIPSAVLTGKPANRRGAPDFTRACQQHRDLCEALSRTGFDPLVLKPDPLLAKAALVRGLAVITPTLAVFSQAAGVQEIANKMATDRILKFIVPPGTMDANDVVFIDGTYFIGISARTNEEGAGQLAFFLKEYGYQTTIIPPFEDSDTPLSKRVAQLPDGRLLIDRTLEKYYAFLGFNRIVTDEPGAAGGFSLGQVYFMPAGFKNTPRALEQAGISICEIDISEFEKTGAGLSDIVLFAPRKTAGTGSAVLPFYASKA